jgi:hypothetical protein
MTMKRVPLYITVATLSLMAFTAKDVLSAEQGYRSSDQGMQKEVVSVTPNPTTDGTVVIANNDAQEVHVYLFDEENTMLNQVHLPVKGRQQVTGLQKGTLTYEVFQNDISIKQGKIISK